MSDLLLHAPDCPRNAPNEGMCSCWPERDRRIAAALASRAGDAPPMSDKEIADLLSEYRALCMAFGVHGDNGTRVSAMDHYTEVIADLIRGASRGAGDAPPDPGFAAVRTAVREAFDRDAPKLAELCCESRPAALSIADMRHWLGNAVAVAFKLRGASRVPVGDATLREERKRTELLERAVRLLRNNLGAKGWLVEARAELARAASPVPKEKP